MRNPADKFHLEDHAPHYGRPDCKICYGMGIQFDPAGGGKAEGAFVLCACVEEMTLCAGKAPYEYYDSARNVMAACPSKPARLALDRIRVLLRKSGVPARYSGRFFSTIDLEYTYLSPDEGKKAHNSMLCALDYAIDLFRTMGTDNVKGLYLYGGTGCGKTLIACATLNEMIRLYQLPVRYAKINRDVIGRLKDTFNPNSESYGEGAKIEAELAEVPVLVIDDFGVHQETPWVNAIMYNLIDQRYEDGRPTIITSNDPIEALKETMRGRLYSRINEMCNIVRIEAPDYRLKGRPL